MSKIKDIPDRKRTSSDIPSFVALSFFSGAVGLDIGLHNVGIETLLACEVDKACRNTITLNFPEMGLIGDIWDYTATDIYRYANLPQRHPIDLIVGGPPCQAFSTAGKRGGFADPRGNVFLRFLDLIGELLPRYVVIENVRGLLSAEYEVQGIKIKGGALYTILEQLRSFGYQVSFNLYNSANFGVPQIRERVILIAHLGERKVPHLLPTHSDDPYFGLPKWVTLREAFSLLPPHITHTHAKFPPKRLEFYRLLTEGQNWRDLPKDLQEKALGGSKDVKGGKTGIYRRLAWDKPSPTLLTSPTMFATSLGHPTEDRPLSVEEYKVIQGFGLTYEVAGTTADKYRQLGNAVPVKMAEAIGTTILAHRNCVSVPIITGFPHTRYKDTDEVSWERNFLTQLSEQASKR